MQSTELKSGNWINVYVFGGWDPKQVTANEILILENMKNGGTGFVCVGIPLTEEWLLKFGFEEKHTSFDGGHHYWSLTIGKLILSTPFENDSIVEVDGLDIQIKYVHRLQNAVSALAETELTIKS